MRKALRWLLALTVLIGTLSTAGAATAAEPDATGTTDIKERLLAIPGMSLIEEKPYTGYRFFVLNYTQPVDHRRPSKGTFQQRITVLHKDTARPTVFYTGGAIDLGEAAAETLALVLDPFPRSPGAQAALREAGVLNEEEAGPFAALAKLKQSKP